MTIGLDWPCGRLNRCTVEPDDYLYDARVGAKRDSSAAFVAASPLVMTVKAREHGMKP